MKKTTVIIVFTLFIMSLWSCDCVEGTGELQTQKRKVENFDRLQIDVSAQVYLKQGENTEVIITAQQNILDVITTEVSNNTLEIDNKNNCFNNNKGISIYITVPDLNKITLDGSGDIKSVNKLTFKKLKMKINGSGSIMLDVESDYIYGEVNGSGSYSFSGIAKEQEYDIHGSGEVNAFDMPCTNCKIDVAGSGNCRVMAIRKLDVSITGSGSVFYKGSPEISTDISGSGSINKED